MISLSVSSVTRHGQRRWFTKAGNGRGGKTSPWILTIYRELCGETHCIRKLWMKLSTGPLSQRAKDMINNSTDGLYHSSMWSGKHESLIYDLMTPYWVHRLSMWHSIVEEIWEVSTDSSSARKHSSKSSIVPRKLGKKVSKWRYRWILCDECRWDAFMHQKRWRENTLYPPDTFAK